VKKVPTNVNYRYAQKSDFYDAPKQNLKTPDSLDSAPQFLKNCVFCDEFRRFLKSAIREKDKIKRSNSQ